MTGEPVSREPLSGTAERLRWRVVDAVERLWPGQCRSRLVDWALDGPALCHRRGDSPWPWRPIDDLCRRDAAENEGRCYCSAIGPLTPETLTGLEIPVSDNRATRRVMRRAVVRRMDWLADRAADPDLATAQRDAARTALGVVFLAAPRATRAVYLLRRPVRILAGGAR